MSKQELYEKIHNFYFKLLPQVKLSSKIFSKEELFQIVKDGNEIQKLAEIQVCVVSFIVLLLVIF